MEPASVVSRLLDLDEARFNLALYLVLSHHGKARATLAMSPRDQDNPGCDGDLPIRGVRDGDDLPALALVDIDGEAFELPSVTLRLEPAKIGLSRRYGPSWVERVVALRESYGAFQLAWLEALVRAADVRASRIAEPLDPRVPAHLAEVVPLPESEDRGAELRQWIQETLAGVDEERGPARAQRRRSPKTHRTAAGANWRGSS